MIGAGPKAAALAAKTHVLNELGLGPISLTIVEAQEPAASWLGSSGFTSGLEALSTTPAKDVGFPYKSTRTFGAAGSLVDDRLIRFSWQQYLIKEGLYQTWIDAGMPCVTHREYGLYVAWVLASAIKGVCHVRGQVSRVSLEADNWRVDVRLPAESIAYRSEALVITGPGVQRPLPHAPAAENRIFYCDSRRTRLESLPNSPGCDIAIAGGGESALACITFLRLARPDALITVYTPDLPMSRAESFLENRVYSDPDSASWRSLGAEKRRDFIKRSDRGVFAGSQLVNFGYDRRCSFVTGRVLYVGAAGDGDGLQMDVGTAGEVVSRRHDYVVNCTGFDVMAQLRTLIPTSDRVAIERRVGAIWDTSSGGEPAIGHALELAGMTPMLHVPGLAAFSQGPGFANLSCLGTLADRILQLRCQARSRAKAREELVNQC